MSAAALPDTPNQLEVQGPGSRNGFWKRFFRHPFAIPGSIIVFVVVMTAILAPVIATKPYARIYTLSGLSSIGGPLPPQWRFSGFFLGTDQLGRDVFSRLVWAARVSVQVGVFATLISGFIGVAMGVVAGYYKGWVDNLLMRFTDIMLGFPFLLFIILIVSIVSPSVAVIYVTIGVFGWTTLARVARSQALSVSQQPYVEAAQSLGGKNLYIMLRHVLPNMLAPVVVLATMAVAQNIIFESTLSFLGIGVPTPIPSWGKMISEGLPYLGLDPTLVLFPALAVSITTIGFNLLGDALNHALNPRN